MLKIRLSHLGLVLVPMFIIGCGGSKTTQKTTARKPPVTVQLPQPEAKPQENIHISIAYPTSGEFKPKVDSNFILGSVGNGAATLTINGIDIPVSKNGAFLAFLPMPTDGVYHLMAERGNDRDSTTVSYRPESLSSPATTPGKSQLEPMHTWAMVVKGSDTLQTGSDVTPGSPSIGADRKWFFPRGARLLVEGKEGHDYKIALDKGLVAWVADTNLQLGGEALGSVGNPSLISEPEYFDFAVPSGFSPFLVEIGGSSIVLNIYNPSGHFASGGTYSDPLLTSVSSRSNSNGVSTYDLYLNNRVWGYKVFYRADGTLVLRVRRPPVIAAFNPLRGIRIMIDPGHPPGGAIGPTGLTEAEANLAIAMRVRDQLTAKGAIVLMTHTDLNGRVSSTNQIVELDARTEYAVRENVQLMVSIHNNAFPDGTNPFNSYGTSTYYYHPFSAELAGDLDREIASVTGIPNLNANHKSLAVCRPTWMPCALTESLYMMFPDQEQALRDPGFLDRLAAAHVRGIEDFLRSKAQ